MILKIFNEQLQRNNLFLVFYSFILFSFTIYMYQFNSISTRLCEEFTTKELNFGFFEARILKICSQKGKTDHQTNWQFSFEELHFHLIRPQIQNSNCKKPTKFMPNEFDLSHILTTMFYIVCWINKVTRLEYITGW